MMSLHVSFHYSCLNCHSIGAEKGAYSIYLYVNFEELEVYNVHSVKIIQPDSLVFVLSCCNKSRETRGEKGIEMRGEEGG